LEWNAKYPKRGMTKVDLSLKILKIWSLERNQLDKLIAWNAITTYQPPCNRALALEDSEADLLWFWIGEHKEYERLVRSQ
jgi:hypothetical protein